MKTEKRKTKPSILDMHADEIKQLVTIGVSVPNITKIINSKLPEFVHFSEAGIRSYIKRRGFVPQTEAAS
jgi:hypothetical protein